MGGRYVAAWLCTAAGCHDRRKMGQGRLSSQTVRVLRRFECRRSADRSRRCSSRIFEKPRSRMLSERLPLLTALSRQTLRFSAEVLPRLATSSYSTVCPSLSDESPAFSTAEICTNTSLPPVEGWMKPKPLVGLNHFTVPLAITSSPQD